uniref:Ribonuclease A M2 n=1 Tax=Loxodonta africana TaxID=9785 RepID=G3UI63_LOXAF|nr:TPA: ribonuclease A M2 [Loxodonta africana]
MASSLKVLGSVFLLLLPLWEQLIYGQNLSREEFMKQHHLRPSQAFSQYKCDVLMKEIQGLKEKNSHIFLYTPWHQIYNVCFRTWRERKRNVYVWSKQPFKTLKCSKRNSEDMYREKRSYSYVEFHCSVEGYVDSIEDLQVLGVIYY